MPDNENYQGDEKLLILPLGEKSKKITQVISNDTARQIIELLADAPLSANDIAQRLQAPLTTITYNLENLESVGLIKVEKIKYSEKGREVKIYAPVRKLIVLVPEKTDRGSVADLLRKYLGIILTAFFASSLIEFFMRKPGNNAKLMQTNRESYSLPPPAISELPASTNTSIGIVNETVNGGDIAGAVPIPAAKMVPHVPTPDVQSIQVANSTPIVPALDSSSAGQGAPDIFTNLVNNIIAHPGLVFFMGCLFMIALFIIMDYRRKRKNEQE
jgi:DNA-binding transcriptional ArsR family regulator